MDIIDYHILLNKGWAVYDNPAIKLQNPIIEAKLAAIMTTKQPITVIGKLLLCPLKEVNDLISSQILHDISGCWFSADYLSKLFITAHALNKIRPHMRLLNEVSGEYGPELLPFGILFEMPKKFRKIDDDWQPSIEQVAEKSRLVAF